MDGSALQWGKYPRFSNLSDNEIAQLSILHEYDTHEQERMEINTWWVAKEQRVSMVHLYLISEYINSFVTDNPKDAFFFNHENINQFNKTFGVDGNSRILLLCQNYEVYQRTL